MPRWPERLPHPALVFVVFAWGCNFVVIKYSLVELPVNVMMLLRYVFMGLALLGYAAAMRLTYRPKREEWVPFLFAGFMSTGLYMVFFLEGMARVGAAQGAVCLATAPIWVSIISVLKGRDRGRWELYVGGAVAYLGVATVILMGSGERHWTPLGLVFTLGSALIWAISVVMMKPLLQDRPAVGVYLATYPGAALILVPYAVMETVTFDYSRVTWVGWGGLAYLVFVAGAGAFTAYYVGVREAGPAKASMTAYFVPVVATFSAWAFQGIPVNLPQAVGVAILLAGVALANHKPATKESTRAAAPADEIA